MVLDTENEGNVDDWSIYCTAKDLTETICGTFDTDGFKFGDEVWINKEIVSFRIVGNPADSANWFVTICLMGPMGTSYVHLTPVPASLSIQQGQQVAALTIDQIQAETGFEITNVLGSNLRQKPGSELSWATTTNGATEATTVFDVCPPAGDH